MFAAIFQTSVSAPCTDGLYRYVAARRARGLPPEALDPHGRYGEVVLYSCALCYTTEHCVTTARCVTAAHRVTTATSYFLLY